MSLEDILSSPEMCRYFENLTHDVQTKLYSLGDEIHSSNDLYMLGEKFIASKGDDNYEGFH